MVLIFPATCVECQNEVNYGKTIDYNSYFYCVSCCEYWHKCQIPQFKSKLSISIGNITPMQLKVVDDNGHY